MRSDKRGGSLTKSSLFPFCIRPPIQLYCGLKGFQNCKCTVHYAPCLWRNTSASRSKFKETPFKVKWQGKYWSNWFCSIHVHSILISLTFFFFDMKFYWGDLNLVSTMIIQQIPLSSYQIHYVPHIYHCSTNKTYPQSDVFFCKEAICKACLSCTLNIPDSQIFEQPTFETSILRKVIKNCHRAGICWCQLNSNLTDNNSTFTLLSYTHEGFRLRRAPSSIFAPAAEENR